tara:strand:+ start:566 stop:772 length:207 start_codon:yes stop_codon:yes gene_type:complete
MAQKDRMLDRWLDKQINRPDTTNKQIRGVVDFNDVDARRTDRLGNIYGENFNPSLTGKDFARMTNSRN